MPAPRTEEITASAAASAGHRVVPCAVCGGEGYEILLSPADVVAEQSWLGDFHAARVRSGEASEKDRARFTQSEPTYVVCCDACGTVRRDPQPTCSALRVAYASDAYGEEALSRLAANQEEFFRAKLVELGPELDQLGSGARVLEVGSFVGGFLAAARERGWRAVGIDVGEETSEFVRRAGFEVIRGDLTSSTMPPPGQDAVFIWNTFDQLCDPAEALRRVRELLRPGGVVVLRVPNGRFESACLDLRMRLSGTRRDHHVLCAQAYNNFLTFPYLTGYTPESLTRLLATHGFVVTSIAGDTIVQSAGPDTLPCAIEEEARYRRAVMRACDAAERATGARFHPWIDVVAAARDR